MTTGRINQVATTVRAEGPFPEGRKGGPSSRPPAAFGANGIAAARKAAANRGLLTNRRLSPERRAARVRHIVRYDAYCGPPYCEALDPTYVRRRGERRAVVQIRWFSPLQAAERGQRGRTLDGRRHIGHRNRSCPEADRGTRRSGRKPCSTPTTPGGPDASGRHPFLPYIFLRLGGCDTPVQPAGATPGPRLRRQRGECAEAHRSRPLFFRRRSFEFDRRRTTGNVPGLDSQDMPGSVTAAVSNDPLDAFSRPYYGSMNSLVRLRGSRTACAGTADEAGSTRQQDRLSTPVQHPGHYRLDDGPYPVPSSWKRAWVEGPYVDS